MVFFGKKTKKQKVIVTGSQLIKKAKEFANEFGLVNYVPSNGWFCRWKKRLELKVRKAQGEKNSANTEAAESWIENRMLEIMDEYREDKIYNADKTLLWLSCVP